MKKLIAVVLLLSVFALASLPILAQENVEEYGVGETQEISDPALKLELSTYGQEYPEKTFPVTVEIASSIDSSKVGVEWNYPESLLVPVGEQRDIVTVINGQTTLVTKEFQPTEFALANPRNILLRRAEVGVRVNAFVADRNFLSSTALTVEFNEDMEVIPQYDEYKTDKLITTIITISGYILIFGLIVAVILLAVKRFRTWLNTEDVET